MKTIEEKAQAYDLAVKRIKNEEIIDHMTSSEIKEFLFPDLVESEDERMLNAAIKACKYMVDNFENSTKQYEDAIAWLEKQSVQKPAEWSEDDKKMLERIIIDGEDKNILLPNEVDWLKSLKEKYAWKPSDEQMEALKWQINNTHEGSWQYAAAKELYNQLKELKGE